MRDLRPIPRRDFTVTNPTEPIDETLSPVSIRIRHQKIGDHVHARVFSSEFGPETTHGLNGILVFRLVEWEAFRDTLELGYLSLAAVQFVDDEKEPDRD